MNLRRDQAADIDAMLAMHGGTSSALGGGVGVGGAASDSRSSQPMTLFFMKTGPRTEHVVEFRVGQAYDVRVVLLRPKPTVFNKANAVPISFSVKQSVTPLSTVHPNLSYTYEASLRTYDNNRMMEGPVWMKVDRVPLLSGTLYNSENKEVTLTSQRCKENSIKSTSGTKVITFTLEVTIKDSTGQLLGRYPIIHSFAVVLGNGGTFYKLRAWAFILQEEYRVYRHSIGSPCSDVVMSDSELAVVLRSLMTVCLEGHDMEVTEPIRLSLAEQITGHFARRVYATVGIGQYQSDKYAKTEPPLINFIGMVGYVHAVANEWDNNQDFMKVGRFPMIGTDSEVQKKSNEQGKAFLRFRSGNPERVVLHYPNLEGKAKQYTTSDLSHAFFLSVMLRALQTRGIEVDGMTKKEVDTFIAKFTALDPNNGATQFLLPALDRAGDVEAANIFLYNNAQGVKSRSQPVLRRADEMPVQAKFLHPPEAASAAHSSPLDQSYAYCGQDFGFDFNFGSHGVTGAPATGTAADLMGGLGGTFGSVQNHAGGLAGSSAGASSTLLPQKRQHDGSATGEEPANKQQKTDDSASLLHEVLHGSDNTIMNLFNLS